MVNTINFSFVDFGRNSKLMSANSKGFIFKMKKVL